MLKPHGILPAVVTPLTKQEQVNKGALRQIIEYTLEGGVHGIFALGATAEFYGLDYEAYKKTLEVTVDQVAGRVPVYAGVNCITTKEAIRLAKITNSLSVDAISILTPMFLSPNDDQLYDHFKAIAQVSKHPVLLYNNPPRTGVNISPALVERLASIDNIIGIKDSSGDMTQTSEYIRRTSNKNFYVMMGRDTLIYANLCYGGVGGVAACANIAPKICTSIYDSFIQGDHKKACYYQHKLAPLRIAFGIGTFPRVIKEALAMIGIDAGPCFAPAGDFTTQEREALRKVLIDIGIL